MKCEIYENGRIEIKASEAFFASEGYCLFHVKACGICGSDAPRVFSGASYYYPIVLGHEFSGYVAESTKSELVGKRACVFPILPCGECEFCKKQAWASCIRYDYYGSRRDGGMQSELLIKEDNLVFLPDSVSFEAGAMVEPSAVCLHAVKRAGVSDGSHVLIYGAGTIGLLCAMWARILGAEGVYLKEPDPTRCSFVEKIGFSVYGGESVDVIIEASGAQAALSDAIENCQPLGRVALVGHGKADVTLKHETFVKILHRCFIKALHKCRHTFNLLL